MNGQIIVDFEYGSVLATLTGKQQESVLLPENVEKIQPWIKDYLKNAYGITQPVLVLLNGRTLAGYIKDHRGKKLPKGVRLKVLPIISGG